MGEFPGIFSRFLNPDLWYFWIAIPKKFHSEAYFVSNLLNTRLQIDLELLWRQIS